MNSSTIPQHNRDLPLDERESMESLWTAKDVGLYLRHTGVHVRAMFRAGCFPPSVAFKLPESDRIRFRPDLLKLWAEGRLAEDEMGGAE